MPADWQTPPRNLTRNILIWFGCFIVVASFLVLYFRMPLFPLLLGGALALAVTVIRHWFKK